MKYFLLTTFLLFGLLSNAQNFTVKLTLNADSTADYSLGKVLFYSLPDSTLIKGSYIDSNEVSASFKGSLNDSMYILVRVPNYAEYMQRFALNQKEIDLGRIVLSKDQELDEVKVHYSKPVFERTMDGISVNVKGTTLEELNTLFDVLKASPRLTSPDDESIEIIGLGAPLIRIDRQPIMSNDELRAVPADQVDRIEIITSPSAKYKAEGSGSGVIEVFTNNFKLEGYRATVNLNGGISTQLMPQGRASLGFNYKKKKFTFNAYAGANYNSSIRNGSGDGLSDDGTYGNNTLSESTSTSIWQYYNVKMAYEINTKNRLTFGVSGHGSTGQWNSINSTDYFSNDTVYLSRNKDRESDYKWLRNTAFVNYVFEADTFGSVLEVNLNYLNKINDDNAENKSEIIDQLTNEITNYDVKIISNDRPNIGEVRVNYDHRFDTSGWRLNVGGSYSLLFNGKSFDRYLAHGEEWLLDPIYSNSYDYREDIGALFAEVSKNWDKFGFRVGLRGEYTRLDGFSKSLNQQFMDSSYLLPFPNVSLLFEPNDTIGIKLFYNSGINRPEFDNYDPFVRIEDSLNVNYGNPYLKPAYRHTLGLEFDLFQAYNLTVSYNYVKDPMSTISFVNDSTYITERVPWNALKEEGLEVSLGLPIETSWLSGWNSIWIDYSKYTFGPEFDRAPFFNLTYGLYSYLTFKLPKSFSIMNRISLHKWGSDDRTSNANFQWGIRVTKKFFNGDMRIFGEVANILPTINKSEHTYSNFTSRSTGQYNFTSFRLGFFYKFGRLKAQANIQDSESGQSGRL